MPHIAVDYSGSLDNSFDRRNFSLALHPELVAIVDAGLPYCKSRFRRMEETVIGDGSADDAAVHVEIALRPKGRTQEAKARLAARVLELILDHLEDVPDRRVHISVEVRDLDSTYRSDRTEAA
ncbi:5-carboxymethyl-2-hydroxymuconate Delta-isomerase [Streptomyces mirabilis]|uniref:5-carboxymethyl-2-hydroxymuconate Delta-isomerase n=1 Tax=Streptomyces mirabilis TaxID=68239 RepID=UPI003685EFEB